MATFGLFALALSGVIVLTLLLALMAPQRHQIGVMKAIGGTREQIAGIYLSQAGILGVAAWLVATPIGVAGGRVLSREFSVLLNFDLTSLAAPVWISPLVAAIGVLVPLIAAALPVARVTEVTVRDALASHGVGPAAFGARRLDRLLTGGSSSARPWLLGVRNSLRRRGRTALTAAIFSTAGASFISALSVRTSMIATLDRLAAAGSHVAANRYALDQHLLMIYVFLVVVAIMLAMVGSLGLTTATSLNVLDSRRELGVLRAIGASPAMVAAIVIVEAVFVAQLSWGLAVLLAWPITRGLGAFVTAALFPDGLHVSLSPTAIAAWLAIATLLAVVSSAMPAVRASRRSIRATIRYE
jgi:ABC-type antimicrobial peptide transport system permease subunit